MWGVVSYYERLHDGLGSPVTLVDTGRVTRPIPYAVDWDRDGDLDLVVQIFSSATHFGWEEGAFLYYERLADGGLQQRQGPGNNPFHGLKGLAAFADLDDDGDVDLILGRPDGLRPTAGRDARRQPP